MLTLAISYLTTSNLPWFMDLTFQVLMRYCSLQHRTLLLSPVTSTTGCCFCFGSVSSFFLELFLHWSPVAYWAPTNLGSSSFSVLSFCLFILFMGFSRQEYWSGLPSPSPVDHILSELSPMEMERERQNWEWLLGSLFAILPHIHFRMTFASYGFHHSSASDTAQKERDSRVYQPIIFGKGEETAVNAS